MKQLSKQNSLDDLCDYVTESAVLGAAIIDKEAPFKMLEIIKFPRTFSNDHFRFIFEAIRRLVTQGIPVDIVTLNDDILKYGQIPKGSAPMLIQQIINNVTSAENIEHHCHILVGLFLRRIASERMGELVQNCYDRTVSVSEIHEKIDILSHNFHKNLESGSREKTTSEVIIELRAKYEKLRRGDVATVTTGLRELDDPNNGLGALEAGGVYIVAARPGIGKSAFCLQVAKHAAKEGGALYFSYEMTAASLVERIVCAHSGKNLEYVKNNYDKIENSWDYAESLNIVIKDDPMTDVNKIRATSKHYKMSRNLKLIVIDYAQKIYREDVGNMTTQLTKISDAIKRLAMELEVPILLIASMSRSIETTPFRRPVLSDLRDCGSLESDADAVVFLYYQKGHEELGIVTFYIAKNRQNAKAGLEALFKFGARPYTFSNVTEALPEITPNKELDVHSEEYMPF